MDPTCTSLPTATPTLYFTTIVDSILGQGGVSSIDDFASAAINGGNPTSFGVSWDNIITNNPASGGVPSIDVIYSGDPKLGSLANNGGPTRTMVLLPGSPAISAGIAVNYPGTSDPITTDQRGVTRVNQDVGATAYSSITVTGSPLGLGEVIQGTARIIAELHRRGHAARGRHHNHRAGRRSSSTDGINWSTSLTIPQSEGTVESTTVYARISPSASVGSIDASINAASPGAADQSVAVTGTVESAITVSPTSLGGATVRASTASRLQPRVGQDRDTYSRRPRSRRG